MARPTSDILADIENFQPVDDTWLSLDEILDELWVNGDPKKGVDVLLRVFERFPDHDGYGVFWSIVHGLESIGGYEKQLVESTRRVATEMNLQMVNRLIRDGTLEIEGVSLLSILEEVAQNEDCSADARDWAEGFVEEHRGET